MTTIGRYVLEELVTSGADEFWFARDDALGRAVAVRILVEDDQRVPAFLGAARAAALVDDRRLLRILDVLQLPATDDAPARVAVVSEWANGRTLAQTIEDDGPLPAEQALSIVADVARAIAAGEPRHVSHGRLRPSSVLITDAGEIRVRGLAVDAALRGPLDQTITDPISADVDSLGALLYYLTTGRWPTVGLPALAPAPRRGEHPLPPSQVQASIPRSVDDLVGRSLVSAERPRGSTNIADAATFASEADLVAQPGPPTLPRPPSSTMRRIGGVGLAVVLVMVIAFIGWQLATRGTPAVTANSEAADDNILTTTDLPTERPTANVPELVETALVIDRGRSFDPFGDDNGDGRPDRRRGRENHADRGLAVDGDPATAWSTDRYSEATLGDKPGVGYLVDLGAPQTITSISVTLTQPGADVAIKTSDVIYPDPDLWTPFADVPVASDAVTVRSPRPISAQYVLVWITRLPADLTSRNTYRVGISDITVRG